MEMQTVTTISDLRALRGFLRPAQTVGFVPTMGYLHAGHMSLVEMARSRNDVVAVSISVNPAQFGPGEDFTRYPRDAERDLGMLEEGGVDWVFAPPVEEVYPPGHATD